MTLHNVNVNRIQAIKIVLDNLWFGTPIRQFFVILIISKIGKHLKTIEKIRPKVNLR